MERSFKKEAELLRLGAGQTFHGEGILAVTKALLQSGVSYVGGYQGAPASEALVSMCTPRPPMMSRASLRTSITCETGAPW